MRLIRKRRDYIELTENHDDYDLQHQTDIQLMPRQTSSSPQSPSPSSSHRLMEICSGQALKDITSQVENYDNQQPKAKVEFALPKYVRRWNIKTGLKNVPHTRNPSDIQRIGITERPKYHREKFDQQNGPHFIVSEWKLAHEHPNAGSMGLRGKKSSRSMRGSRPRGPVSKLLTIEENEEFDERLHEF
ncbi:hypothetical protein ACHAXS_006745 [Conticribra weissflogii]